jgi:hypothetical protein
MRTGAVGNDGAQRRGVQHVTRTSAKTLRMPTGGHDRSPSCAKRFEREGRANYRPVGGGER